MGTIYRYSVHPTVDYARTIIDNLPARTGRSIEAWVELLLAEGLEDKAARKAWLKQEHGLGLNTHQIIVDRADGSDAAYTDPACYLEAAVVYVEDMYGGPKAGLRPIYDRVIEFAGELGKDVRICPCKTMVPLYRERVFAQIKPTTRKRVDLGLALRETKEELSDRLLPTGGLEKGDRITHRIGLTCVDDIDDIDDETLRWLEIAYRLDAR